MSQATQKYFIKKSNCLIYGARIFACIVVENLAYLQFIFQGNVFLIYEYYVERLAGNDYELA